MRGFNKMLNKVSYFLAAAFLISQPVLAVTRGTEVLAVCTKATDKAQSFQVKGESSRFFGPRLGPIVQDVTVVDISGEMFPGQVTLTKMGPYQYALYGQYVGKAAPGEHIPPVTTFYGNSAGSKMFVQENESGKTITAYECDMNMNLLATP
jgi:hypothetical protein